jgi:acyl-CoA thioester hydrolase
MTTLDDFTFQTFDKIRYGDTDRQGHVNNAVFTTLFETGRVGLIYSATHPIADPDASFVIVRLVVEYKKEIHWPGTVEIGTRVVKVGASSLGTEQALFQDGVCVATAESVLVHFDGKAHKSRPLSAASVEYLRSLVAVAAAK